MLSAIANAFSRPRISESVSDYLARTLRMADGGSFLGARKAVFLGATFSAILDPATAERTHTPERFDGIPTMVTQRELRLLTNLFATIPVDGAVLEIGCYLGGSTAAIARGLDAAGAANRLYVLDSFAWSDPGFVAHLGRDIDTLQMRYRLSPAALAATREGDWHLAFHDIHSRRPYYRRLRIHKALIPYASADAFDLATYVPPGMPLGAIFIDGFKSWESTYSAMTALVPYIIDGALLIFQDFSWYDCYWLPVLTARLGLKMIMKVDNTAVFRVVNTDIISGVEAFGSEPDPDCYPLYRDIIVDRARTMFHAGDEVGFLLHTAQSYVLAFMFDQHGDAKQAIEFLRQACERLNVGWLMDDLISKPTFQVHA